MIGCWLWSQKIPGLIPTRGTNNFIDKEIDLISLFHLGENGYLAQVVNDYVALFVSCL